MFQNWKNFNRNQISDLDSSILAIIWDQSWVLGYQMKGMDSLYVSNINKSQIGHTFINNFFQKNVPKLKIALIVIKFVT